jgi:hypothetical protein
MALSANQLEILLKAKDTASAVIKKVSSSMKSLGNTAKSVGSAMTKAFKGVFNSIFNLKSGFVALAGAAGIGYAIKRSYEFIDTLGKTSSKLGVAVEDLQRLRYAAKIGGIETQTLDMALQRFTRRASEAAAGTGEAKAALEEMGIQLTDNNGNMKSTQTLLGDVAEAFTKVKDPSDRLRLAFKLFDSEGVAMVNILNQGRAGLEKMTSQADKLGFVLDKNTIKGVEKANDAFTSMGMAIGGVWDKIVASLAPAFEGFATWLAEFAGGLSTQITPAFKSLSDTFRMIVGGLGGARQAGEDWGSALSGWIGKVKAQLMNFFLVIDKDGTTAWDRFQASVEKFKEEFQATWDEIKSSLPTWDEFKYTIIELKSYLDGLASAARSLADALKAVADWYKRIAASARAAGSAIANTVGAGSEPQRGARAAGGPVRGGGSYLVGERGPEMFTPNQSGTISNKTGGGTTVINNIYTSNSRHGVDNALASRGDMSIRSSRIGLNLAGI